jgi:hypothetical protein
MVNKTLGDSGHLFLEVSVSDIFGFDTDKRIGKFETVRQVLGQVSKLRWGIFGSSFNSALRPRKT